MMIPDRLASLCLLLYALLLSYLSLKAPSPDSQPLMWDKLAHFLAYGGYSVLALAASRSRNQFLEWWIAGFLLGLALEGLQGLTGFRTASLQDQFANTLGLAAGALGAWLPMIQSRWRSAQSDRAE